MESHTFFSPHRSLVTDIRFDALDELRGHLPDAMFLGVLSRFLEYFFFRLTPVQHADTHSTGLPWHIPKSLPSMCFLVLRTSSSMALGSIWAFYTGR
jgi:hypothetical protein